MEVQDPSNNTHPLPAATDADPYSQVHLDSTGGVTSLDDFLADCPPATEVPLKKTTQTSNSPTPVAIGARSSQNINKLHEECQALAITFPEFLFSNPFDKGWSVKLEYLGQVHEDGPFNTKQEAKEAICGKILLHVADLKESGKLKKPIKGKKAKSSEPNTDGNGCSETQKKEPGPNYIGQLLEYQRAMGDPMPAYQDYALGTQFSCIMAIHHQGSPLSFGSTTTMFGSKKAAQQHVAGLAVQHIKDAGLWPDTFTDMGGIKKKKKPQSPSESLVPVQSPGDSADASPAQQVVRLALELGLSAPEYRFTQEGQSLATGFHNVECFFKNGGQHEGPIGTVKNIFGRKKAKDECARLTLDYLQQVMKVRQERVRKLLEDTEVGIKKEETEVSIKEEEEEDAFEDAHEKIHSY